MKSTATYARESVEAARQGDVAKAEMELRRAEQQDKATRLVLYVVSGLMVVSVVANIALVAFTLNQAFSVNASKDGVGVSVGKPVEAAP